MCPNMTMSLLGHNNIVMESSGWTEVS